MVEPVPVRVRGCTCPGSPHPDGDVVYLNPTLDLDAGLAAEGMLLDIAQQVPIVNEKDPIEINRVAADRLIRLRPLWFPLFVRSGATGWNLVDEEGEPVPFDLDVIMGDYAIARIVAAAADQLYQSAVLAPFLTPPDELPNSGRTAGGTRPPSEPTPLRSGSSSRRPSAGPRSATAR